MRANFSLQEKLWILMAVALFSLLGTVGVGVYASSTLSKSTTDLSEKSLSTMLVLGKARAALSTANTSLFKFTNEIRAGQTAAVVTEKLAEVRKLLDTAVQKAQEADKAFESVGTVADESNAAENLATAVVSYQKKLQESLDVIVADVSVGGMMLMTTEEDFARVAKLFDARDKHVEKSVLAAANESVQLANRSRQWLVLVGLSGVAALFFMGVTTIFAIRKESLLCVAFTNDVARGDLKKHVVVTNQRDEFGQIMTALNSMQKTMREKVDVATKIACGDLTVEVRVASEDDELGIELQNMREGLLGLVLGVSESFQKVAEETEKLQRLSSSLRKTAHDQAASLEQMSASLREVSSRVQENTSATCSAESHAKTTSTLAHSGRAKIASLELSIEEIHSASKQVSSVIKVIDDIAFQTNLLALNASVEAARAGVHGRGFAVVAEEVRGLASRSAKAAGQSGALIEGSLRSVANGLSMTKETSQGYEQVFSGIEHVTAEMQTVSKTSSAQARELVEVTASLNHLGGITQETASLAENLSHAVSLVANHGSQVENLLKKFRLS